MLFLDQCEYEVTAASRDCKEGCKCLGKDNISSRVSAGLGSVYELDSVL